MPETSAYKVTGVKKAAPSYSALGTTGLNRHGGYIYEEFLPELRWPHACKVYQEMSENDPVIGSILYLAEMLIRGTKWSVEPASNSKADIEASEFLESCMNDMDRSWASTISEILSMLTYGFSFHEIVYKVRRGLKNKSAKFNSKYSDGKVGWKDLPIRAQSSLHSWEFDEYDDVTAFVQAAEPAYNIVVIPMSRGLLFRTRVSKDNPEGRSLLRNAYRSWFFKKHFEEIEGIGIERDLAGFPILTAPENINLFSTEDPIMVDLRIKAESIVASVRRDSDEGLVLPYGWDLKLLTSGSSRQIDIGETISRYDNRIAITMLSDIVLLGNKSGSFALAEAKQTMLAAALQSQLENIADIINKKAVTDLFEYNSFEGITELPKIVAGQLQTPSLKEVALLMRSMGLNIAGDLELQNHLRRILGAPELDEEVFASVYENQLKDNAKEAKADATEKELEDTASKDLEQNDLNYTGAGD